MARGSVNRTQAFDQGLARTREMRAFLEHSLRQRLGETEALLKRLCEDFKAMPGRLEKANRVLEGRRKRVAAIEKLLIEAAGRQIDQDKHNDRVAELERTKVLVRRSEERIGELERAIAHTPDEIASLKYDRDRLEALLADGAGLDERAAAAGARRASTALLDQKAATAAQKREKAGRVVFDRDGPTPEQISQRGLDRAPGSMRPGELGADISKTVKRLLDMGKIDKGEARAAVMYEQDYRFGTDRAKLVSTYEPGVGGSGRSAGDVADSRLQAYERWRAAEASMPQEFRQVVNAVVLNDLTLIAAPGIGSEYASADTNRRAANAVLLISGLKRLRYYYNC